MNPVIDIQILILRPGVGVMTRGKFRLFLGVVRRMDCRNCNRMVLMVFRMAVFVLAFWVVIPGCGVGRPCW